MDAVKLSGLSFRYRGGLRPALWEVTLAAAPGERVGVIGLTGAGKSTLLRALNRVVPRSFRGEFAGEVRLFGENIAGRRPAELAPTLGLVFQDFESQLFSSTALLDAAFGPENLGLSGDEIRARATEALAAVGLAGFERRDPATLSGGQKQRLAIASVLALRPRILCLDEPTTDLDPQGRAEIRVLLSRLCGEGRTVILAEHEPDLLYGLDRIVGLEEGKVVADLPAAQALADPQLLERLGVRPPDTVQIAARLGLAERPLEPARLVEMIRGTGRRVSPSAIEGLRAADARREAALGEPVIEVSALEHHYPGGAAGLCGVDLSIRRGDFVALCGRNGSGKTTLVRHLVGLLRPTAGEVRVSGRPTGKCSPGELGREIGFVFQDPDHQIFAGRVYDEVAFAPRNYGFNEAEVGARVERALALVGLTGAAEQDPFVMTKGERQRVAIASVLAAEPPMVILDEPTTGLDYPAQRAVMELLKEENRQGRTVVVISHALWVAAEYARRVVVQDGGRIVADGPARDVLADAGIMDRAGLRVPEAAEIGALLGAPALSADELCRCLERP